MRKDGFGYIAAFLCILLTAFVFPAAEASAKEEGMIRVRLTRLGSPASVTFVTDCVYCLNGDAGCSIPAGSELTVKNAGGSLLLESGDVSADAGTSLTLMRKTGGDTGVRFTKPALSNRFCGDVRFTASGGSVVTILTMYVEDYLYGVVGYEMSNSYPIEALKAQAVAARNYVLRAAANRTGKAWDVKDTTDDQVFRGYNASQTNVIRAVDETAGWVLQSGGKLAACFYTASNGGQTEATRNVWGSVLSYSIVKDDPYDLASGATARSIMVPRDWTGLSVKGAFEQALRESMRDTIADAAESVHILGVTDLSAEDPKYPSPSRLFRKLRFTLLVSDGEKEAEVPAVVGTYGEFESWFSLGINQADNETVWVEECDGGWTVVFRRYGHGVGLSQRGARTMAKDHGMKAAEILEFYYPGTKAAHLNLKDTTGTGIVRRTTAAPTGTAEPAPAATSKPTMTPKPTQTPKLTQVPETGKTPAPTARPSPPDGEGITAYVNVSAGSRLNIRAAASSAGKVLGSIAAGTKVTVYSVRGSWAYLKAGKLAGYAAKQYLSLEPSGTPAPTAAPVITPKPSPSPKSTKKTAVIAQVTGTGRSRLNVRTQASTRAAVITSLKAGTCVYVTKLSGDWAKIETASGLTGWVAKRYLTRVK